MATRTDSQAWRSILRWLVPAAVLGATLGLWQAGAFDDPTSAPVAEGGDAQRAPAASGMKAKARLIDESAASIAEDSWPGVQTAMQEVPPLADADELAEEAALQQALAQEQANGG